MADQDNRQHRRFKVQLKSLNGTLGDNQIMSIIDLSVGGIAIESDYGLDVGSEYFMRLEARNHILEVQGTVIWSRIVDNGEISPGQRSPVYISAMRFRAGSEDRVTDFICDARLIVSTGVHAGVDLKVS